MYRKTDLPEEVLQDRLDRLRRTKGWCKLIYSLVITASTVFVLFGGFFGIALVRGQSMAPSFRDGDIGLIWRLSQQYVVDDVVFFKRNPSENELIKRVVAIPGDTVNVDAGGRIVINGNVLEEAYVKPDIQYPITLKEDEYFVLGDNLSVALDSRNFGPVKISNIDGKVILVLRIQTRRLNYQ